MSAITPERETLTIPADLAKDARSALVSEIMSLSECLRDRQREIDAGGIPDTDEDRASTLRWLRENVEILGTLTEAERDTEVTGGQGTLLLAVELLGKLLTEHLREEFTFGPVDMGKVDELLTQLRWVREHGTRLGGRTVTLSRAQREALYEDVEHTFTSVAGGLHHYVSDEDKQRVGEAIESLRAAAKILDYIGWDPQDDRESFTLAVDAGMVRYADAASERGRRTLVDDERSDPGAPPEDVETGERLAALDRALIEAAELIIEAVA